MPYTMTDPVQAAAMEFARRRLMADMAARGVQVPQMGAQTPRLPTGPPTVPAGGEAPPYWPGAWPQPQTAPTVGAPTPSPVPGVQVPEGAASGATTAPIQPQGRLARLMQVLGRPDMADFLTNTGAAIAAPPQPGVSPMQQIIGAIAGGRQAMRQGQQQRTLANFEIEQRQREQARKERETEMEGQNRAEQIGINREQVQGTLAQGKAALEQRKAEAQQEAAWRTEANAIDRLRTEGSIDEAKKRSEILLGQLDAENRKVDEIIRSGQSERDMAPRKMAVEELRAQAAKLQALAALKHMEVMAAETKDPIQKATIDLAGKLVMAQYGIQGGELGAKVGGQAGTAGAIGAVDVNKAISQAREIVNGVTNAKTAAPQGKTIRVKLKSSGQTGTIPEEQFDSKTMTKLE